MISLDNNAAERALRRPVVTRKNAYGSRNDDAARLTNGTSSPLRRRCYTPVTPAVGIPFTGLPNTYVSS